MAEYVDTMVKDIDSRLAALKEEVAKLEAARAALAGARRGPGRPPGSGTRTTTARRGRRPGRPRGSRSGGTRGLQALELVRSRPGITIPEIAKELKIQPNYLYRVMPRLETDGSIKKEGAGYHPAA